MIFLPHFPVALLLQTALCLASATNYSIDDQDPQFQYFGSWYRVNTSFSPGGVNLDEEGGHMLTTTPGSFATITYTFASVYFLSTLWPYQVSTAYGIDGNTPQTIDLQDHSVPATSTNDNATVPSMIVGNWTSTANQQHTIHITIPAGGRYAVVDMFIFEVLDSSSTSSTISSTSQTSSSTGTTSGTASSSSSSGSQGPSTVEHALTISTVVLGTILAGLLVFHLYWFCIRRKGTKNGGNIDPITPQYHPVPTIPENGTLTTHDSLSIRSDGTTSSNLQPPITVSYDRSTSSYSGLPPTLYTNQSTTSSSPRTQQMIHHNPQECISTTPSMMTDKPPMYCHNSLLDESAAASSSSSSSSSNGNTNEKGSPVITLSYTAVAKPEDGVTPTAVTERDEANVNVWDSGYPQPLRFIPIA